jgi:hypothetical protein
MLRQECRASTHASPFPIRAISLQLLLPCFSQRLDKSLMLG